MLIDSHAHLFGEDFEKDVDLVIARAANEGVEKIIVPGIDESSSKSAVSLARKYKGVVWAGVGIHPEEVLRKQDIRIEKIEELIKKYKTNIVAVGEVGIDLQTEEMAENLRKQQKLFREMVNLAQKHNLPLIIHSRKSVGNLLEIVDKIKFYKGVFHCFSGSKKELVEVLKRGFYVSFCGNITWSKRVARLLKLVPEERLLIETDSPFMVPRDERGKPIGGSLRNEPKNVRILAEKYGEIRQVQIAKLESSISNNTKGLFGI